MELALQIIAGILIAAGLSGGWLIGRSASRMADDLHSILWGSGPRDPELLTPPQPACQCPGCDEMSCGLPDCDECESDNIVRGTE